MTERFVDKTTGKISNPDNSYLVGMDSEGNRMEYPNDQEGLTSKQTSRDIYYSNQKVLRSSI